MMTGQSIFTPTGCDRGAAFDWLRGQMLDQALPHAIAAAIIWATKEGLAEDPNVANELAEYVSVFLETVSKKAEADWDATPGADEERLTAILGVPCQITNMERSSDERVH